jgi:UDP-N-acetyl-D-glucosamine dehydrogenase
MNLKNKIENREAQIGVIGLGYVGLPLAIEFVQAGFQVTGIDVDQEKVKKLNRGESIV